MNDIAAEIARIKLAIEKTQSPYLKRDYQKHLQKLLRKQNAHKKRGD